MENNKIDMVTVIAYTDGSCKPSSDQTKSPYGGGVHGYVYKDSSINRVNGDKPKGYYITTEGYISTDNVKKESIQQVNPEMYFDCAFCFSNNGTSPKAEIKAVCETINLQPAEKEKLKKIIIYSDSSYAVLMTEKILNKDFSWDQENTPNLDELRMLKNIIEGYSKDQIEIRKIKGHSGNLGNELADRLAHISCKKNAENNLQDTGLIKHIISKADIPYWNPPKQHPLLEYKQLFFVNNEIYPRTKDSYYSVLNYSSGVDVGIKTHSASFGVVKLNTPDKYIESILTFYSKNRNTIFSTSAVSSCNLTNLYNLFNTRFHRYFGSDNYKFNNKNNHLYNVFGMPIIYSIQPAALAVQAFETIHGLQYLLDTYQLPSKTMTVVDVSNIFYNKSVNKKNIETYKCIIPRDDSLLKLEVDYQGGKLLVPLEIGKDIPTINQFKHLEQHKPKVFLLLKRSNSQNDTLHLHKKYNGKLQTIEEVIKYYTIIECMDGKGIFCNFYSNMIITNDKNFRKEKI